MKYAFALAAFIAASVSVPVAPLANNVIFKMVATSTTCAPGAWGRVTVAPHDQIENLHVEVFVLPPNTTFEFFIIQVPKAPFGLSWYQGDITTDSKGVGVGDFAGIFSKETFTVAPGVAPAPVVFPTDAASNPATPPIQMYHLGLWFNSPTDAVNAGCANTVTPFNGTHNAGVQVLNTSNFGNLSGPLRSVQ
jgi:hypothetical protein